MSFNSRKYYGKRYDEISKYLEVCLKSVKNQSYKNVEITVFDDCSEEDPSKKIRAMIPEAKIFRNEKNLGLLKTENNAIRQSRGKYILILNQDIHLQNDYIEKLVDLMESDKKIGVASGKILRFRVDEKNEIKFSKIIDSAGMIFFRDRNVLERGQEEEDTGKYEKSETVFGITGAAPFYRGQALEDVAISGEYYDEDFFMYKDDVDLCWRLNLRGWKCQYCPKTLAYHARSASGISAKMRKNFVTRRIGYIIHRFIKRKGGSAKTRGRDLCNHYLMLVKNDSFSSLLKSVVPFVWRELQKIVFGILFEPRVFFPGWVDFFKKLSKIKKKRKIIQSRRMVPPKELEKLFCRSIW